MKEFLENNWQAIITVIGGIVVWIYKRPLAEYTLKQQKAEVNTTTIENLERGLKMYVAMLDDIEARHNAALTRRDAQIDALETKVTELTDLLNKHINENGISG
tara:strand:+ start:628 stop:936 length:309 start_codon:yes stop_codon:yes gene_type:complete